MVRLENVTKKFGNRVIFKDFTFEFPKTGVVAIVGESGSGKSTLLNLISGLDNNFDGNATVLDKNLTMLSQRKMANFRLKNIGYVFQNFNLINLDTVFNNIFLPLDTISSSKTKIKKQRVNDCIKAVGLTKLSKTRVNKLSGGEKQRVAIARSIVNDPKIILCDEPTGALDEKNGEAIFKLLEQISSKKLVIIATHDLEGIKGIADVILEIKNNKIKPKYTGNKHDFKDILLIGSNKIKHFPHVSSSFKLRHSFQKMKAKKYRSLIVNVMLSLSLTGVGLSLLITESVTTKVNDAFKAILNGNQIVMSLKNEGENTFTNTYSAKYKSVFEIYEKYKYHFDGIGVNYLVNFEDFFKDQNEFHVSSTSKRIDFPSLSVRNINDFKWLESDHDDILYPMDVEVLDDDEFVLGLSESDMINLCYQLQIQRNYTSLGHYIHEKGLMLTMSIANGDWQYDDEQLFRVTAVCKTSETKIFHTNLLWNEVVFEEMMRMPSDDDQEHQFPWEMLKIYYFRTKSDPAQFLNSAMYDSFLDDFVFERSNNDYNPLLCKPGEVCNEKRIYLYSVDKYAISPSVIEIFKEQINEVESYYLNSDFGYASYASNLFSGFSKNVFLGVSEELVDKAIDADTQLNQEVNLQIDLPPGVVQGNYLNALGDGLRFSSLSKDLLYGRKAVNLNEIVISKGLAEKLDKSTLCLGKYLTFAGEIEEYRDALGNVSKTYNKTRVLVVGIADENKNYIYHNPDWTISFFRDKLGVSSFYLIPKSVVFEFESEDKAVSAYSKFIGINHEYKFTNPLDELKSNIDSTLEYANTILIAFSILSTIISILLLGTVMMLNVIEGKDEVKLFNYLGINHRNINSIFTSNGLTQGLLAFVVSAFELFIVDFIISYWLGDYLNVGFKFSFNSKPVFVVFLLAILIPFLISKIMVLLLSNKRQKV